MKARWKQIGSLLLAFCMVFTMISTTVFAETSDVEIDTIGDELNLLDELVVSGDGIVTGIGTDITDEFSDPNFLKVVRDRLGKTVSEAVYDTDVANITEFYILEKEISSLDGIEYFTGLTVLGCSANRLAKLDLSKNTELIHLSCSDNELTELNVSNNTKLTTLNCYDNKLTKLDVSKNTVLEYLDCSDNELTDLNVSSNAKLTYLKCSYNKLTKLGVSKNTVLANLECAYNQLTKLDVSHNLELTRLSCFNNNLTELVVSKMLY